MLLLSLPTFFIDFHVRIKMPRQRTMFLALLLYQKGILPAEVEPPQLEVLHQDHLLQPLPKIRKHVIFSIQYKPSYCSRQRCKARIQVITPSDAVIIECKLGIESALSIFTITCISAPQPAVQFGTNLYLVNQKHKIK